MSDYDDFELQYADELDALKDLEEDYESQRPKPKRSLQFASPPPTINQQNYVTHGISTPESICYQTVRHQESDEQVEDAPAAKRPKLNLEESPERVSVSGESRNKINTSPKRKISKKSLLDTFPVTGFTGYTVHLNIRNVEIETFAVTGQQICSLLGTPYNVLVDQLERERELRLLREGDGMRALYSEETSSLPEGVRLDAGDDAIQKSDVVEQELWVEKYKPHHFMQLLSDDGINRTLLRWLKLWDKVVFNKDISIKQKVKNETQSGPQNKKFHPKFEMNEDLDNMNRPQYKVVLLCGSPGLGKTTLAYIIAQHAGYNVVEMNASDDRSVDIFKRKLEAATQMRSVLGNEPKPNCLVIDEIDGAPAPAINVLVSYVKSTGAVKGKKGKQPILLRPVLCICNDLYTPALRPLKQLAFILNFPPTASPRLCSRLMDITRKEKLKTDTTALLALCEKAENDIRSCLATLQFLHSAKQEMRLRDVQTARIGQKDSQKTMFFVWQQVFQIPRNNRKQFIEVDDNREQGQRKRNDNLNPDLRAKNVLHLAQSCGEYEKLIQGMFENYLAVSFKDPLLDLVNNGVEWLCFSDLVQQEINHTQLYTLMPYLPYTVVAFHFLFAVLSPVKLKYPSAHYEMKTKRDQLLNIVATVLADLLPSTRAYLDSTILLMQILPFLLHIIQPTLRPVNTQLYSDKEKANLQNVINVMTAYNLAYRQERSPEGQYSYVLEPNVEEVVGFTGIKPINTLGYGAKQMIARELEVDRMRQSDKKTETVATPAVKRTEPVAPNHKQQTLVPKVVKDAPVRDFFGREIKKNNGQIAEKGSNSEGSCIWYHFKEGYSNAVRRTVYIKDLL